MHGLEVEVAGGGVVDVVGVGVGVGVCVCVGARHGGQSGRTRGVTVLLMPPPDARRPPPFRSDRSFQARPLSFSRIPHSLSLRSSQKAPAVGLSSP